MQQWCLEKLSSEFGPTLKEGGQRKPRRRTLAYVDSQKERSLESSQQNFSTIFMNEKYKGPKLFIYSRKGEPNGLEKVEGKRSLES